VNAAENEGGLAVALHAEPELLPARGPTLLLPQGIQTFTRCGEECFRHLATTGKFFMQGEKVVELCQEADAMRLNEVTPSKFRSRLDEFFELKKLERGRERDAVCSLDIAKGILDTKAAAQFLPPIQTIHSSPVFAEKRGELVVLENGYHNVNGGTYVLSDREVAQSVTLERATNALLDLVSDFDFATPADKSRCIAGFISPALRFGGLLKTHFPFDLCEADESQSGKGFRAELITAIYGERPEMVILPSDARKGVGSVDESISTAILSGKGFIVIDNMKGKLDSSLLESAIKGVGNSVGVRKAYSPTKQAKTDHVIWMGTSNKAEVTEDHANRCLITRIKKKPLNYTFKNYKGLSVLEHVEKKREFYQSCVFAVVEAWFGAGKPCNPGVQHDFRKWCGVMDWIVQEIFNLPPLLEGHRAQQDRIASKGLNFLRDVCHAVSDAGRLGEALTAADIANELEARAIEIPGKAKTSEDYYAGAAAIGRLLGPLFKGSEDQEVEEFRIKRTEALERNEERKESRPVKRYTVTREGGTGKPEVSNGGLVWSTKPHLICDLKKASAAG
jgi:hypothetical protein